MGGNRANSVDEGTHLISMSLGSPYPSQAIYSDDESSRAAFTINELTDLGARIKALPENCRAAQLWTFLPVRA